MFTELLEDWNALVIIDCETNGLNNDNHSIIELAAIRIEREDDEPTNKLNYFIRLPEGEKLNPNIVELTGITDEILEEQGLDKEEVTNALEDILRGDKVIIAAHNAHFDLRFISELLRGRKLGKLGFLDTLTIYKDRHKYPHKLENAIKTYGLQGDVKNTHRAIDDVNALYRVMIAMSEERADLHKYINIFGYNPKYAVQGRKIKGVTYFPQKFTNYMRNPDKTLPALVKKRI